MTCNQVLIALTALFAVSLAIPYFPLYAEEAAQWETDYENNERVWGNAPLKAKPRLPWGQWAQPDPQEQLAPSESDNEMESETESEIESENEGPEAADVAAEAAAAGGATTSGEQAAAGAGWGAFGAFGAGNANAVADTGMVGVGAPMVAQEGVIAGANSQHQKHVYAQGGPAPGQLRAGSSRGKGLGIAVGVCLLVVATTTVAVFAIRRYWRHRL